MSVEKIIIERKRRFPESTYSVGIHIDNEFIVNTIKDNTQEIELKPGKYILKVEQGNRSGELEIEVKKGKTATYHFSATNYTYFTFSLMLLAWLFSTLSETEGFAELLFFVPGLLAALYTFTSGRKRYYVINKVDETENWMKN